MTTETIQKLLDAAQNHAVDAGESDHEVGDLQDLLREAWRIMTPGQQLRLVGGAVVDALLDVGARSEFTAATLVAQIRADAAAKEAVITAAGYRIMEGELGFFWETEEEQGSDWSAREDAVADAYAHGEFE